MSWPVPLDQYLAFLTVMAAFAFIPGPAILFAVAAGMNRGVKGVILATLGMNFAAFCWFVASAFGLIVIAETVPWLFKAAGVLGTAYIGWLGIGAIRGALKTAVEAPKALKMPGASVFRDGFIVQATNPKALLFFTAVLPPFVALDRPLPPQMAAFAIALFLLDGFFMTLYGLMGAAFAHKMNEPKFRRIFGLFVGTVLIAVAGMMGLRLV